MPRKQRRKSHSRNEAESTLKQRLAQHHGSTKHPDVKSAMDDLLLWQKNQEDLIQAAQGNTAAMAPNASPLLVGDFICHTLPEFPGRLTTHPDPHVVQYTLGRLSFGIFQPHKLVCTVRSVRQSIRVRNKTGSGKFQTYDYPVLMDLTIHTNPSSNKGEHGDDGDDSTPHDLPAILTHDAVCFPCVNQPDRIKVTFQGSTLMPAPSVVNDLNLLQAWKETFAGVYEQAAQERNIFSKGFQALVQWWFQMELPNDHQIWDESRCHSMNFAMKRPPKGHLDIVYLSKSCRITKGNRGTLVVVEPVENSEFNRKRQFEMDQQLCLEEGDEEEGGTNNKDHSNGDGPHSTPLLVGEEEVREG